MNSAAFPPWETAVGGVGVGGVDLPGHQDVVAGHHAIEAKLVALPGYGGKRPRLCIGSAVGQIETEPHSGPPGLVMPNYKPNR